MTSVILELSSEYFTFHASMRFFSVGIIVTVTQYFFHLISNRILLPMPMGLKPILL